MNYFEKFKKRMELNGGNIRHELIMNGRNLIHEAFADDAAYQENIFFWKLGLKEYNTENAIPIRFYNRKFSDANGETVQFQTPYTNPVVIGDVLFDTIQDEYWICTASFDIDKINYQGKLTKCNWLLKWQLEDGTIVEYPCQDMNSTQYNSGEMSNKLYTIGSAQHMLTLPCDENTVVLDTPQRFYLDKNKKKPTTYRVTQNDTTSYNYDKGLCKVTVTQCPEEKTDNRELGICDYFLIEDKQNNLSVKIKYVTDTIKSGGNAQIFEAVFVDEQGNILDVKPIWNIVCDFINELEVKEFDNKISISIDNDDYIDEDFKLCLSDNQGENITSLIIHIDSLL